MLAGLLTQMRQPGSSQAWVSTAVEGAGFCSRRIRCLVMGLRDCLEVWGSAMIVAVYQSMSYLVGGFTRVLLGSWSRCIVEI